MTSDGALSFERVSRRFGRQEAVRDVTLHCPAGTITCLVGPNGAGKSTLLALAAGLLPASAGRVVAAGRVVRPGPAPADTGYLPQHSAFPAVLRIGEVMRFAVEARRAEPAAGRRALELFGLEAQLDRPVQVLSGGWLRRLGLATALIPRADLLLLDEPFVGLDPETLDRLVDQLRQCAANGVMVLLASHDFEVMDSLAPRLGVLKEGQLLDLVEPGGESCRVLYRRCLSRPDDKGATAVSYAS